MGGRNAVEYRAFVPIAPMGGFGLLHGISKDPHGELRRSGIIETMRQPGTTRVDRDRLILEHALGVMAGDPAAFLRRAFTLNLPDLWRPGSRVLEYAREGEGTGPTRHHGYGGVPPQLGLLLIGIFVASYVLFVVAGILGAALAAAGVALFALLLALSDPTELRELWAFFRVAARVGAP